MWDFTRQCQPFALSGQEKSKQGLPSSKAGANRAPHPLAPQVASRQSGRSSGVEHNLAKVGVEGSNPFARSKNFKKISELYKVAKAAFFHFWAGLQPGYNAFQGMSEPESPKSFIGAVR